MTVSTPETLNAERPRQNLLMRNRFLLARRLVQLSFLGLFLLGPWFGIWIVKGNLTSSLTLDFLPLTDPFVFLQTLVAGHLPETTAIIGAVIVLVTYALLGGRVYCSWVCPMNIVTDTASWVHRKLGMKKGWQPKRSTRYWLLATVLITAGITGTLAYELLNPVTLLHRGLVFGMGYLWGLVVLIFLFDVFVARHGWCGHLCPMGAFYGLLNLKGLVKVTADKREACDNCMDCFDVCPESHVISPALRGKADQTPLILNQDCTACGRCIDVCDLEVFHFTHRFNPAVQPTPSENGASIETVSTTSKGGLL